MFFATDMQLQKKHTMCRVAAQFSSNIVTCDLSYLEKRELHTS